MADNLTINTKRLGSNNLFKIFKLIHKEEEISRVELVKKSDFSAGTISNHVNRLIKNNFVEEKEKGISTGGRKPIKLTINSEKFYIAAVKIGVTELGIYLLDLKLNIIDRIEAMNFQYSLYYEYIDYIKGRLKKILSDNSITSEKLLGIGISVPGQVKRREGVIAFAPNLKWKDRPIISDLNKEFENPIYLDNEAKMGAFGEKAVNYDDVDDLVYVSINEGIGCGLVMNEQIYRGNGDNAGEYGHVVIENNGPECHCGNKGCWETLASENYICRQWHKRTGEKLKKEEIYGLALDGDEKAVELLVETGRNIGTGIANIINGLSPEYIVIGGGIKKAEKIIFPSIKEWAEKRSLEIAFANTVIEFSQLGKKAEIYGVGQLIINNCLVFD